VNKNGQVSGISVGTATITAKYGEASKTCTVKVVPVDSIIVTTKETNLVVGGYRTLNKKVYPSSANQSVVWSSSNDSIVSVDQNGTITGISVGTATITTTASDGSGITCSTDITVEELKSISISNYSVSVCNYENFNISTPQTSNINFKNSDFEWTSSDENVAYVGANGSVLGISSGQATITATAKDGSGVTGSVNINVYNDYTQASEAPRPHGDGISVLGVYYDNASEVSWRERSNSIYGIYNSDTDNSVYSRLYYLIDLETPQKLSFRLARTSGKTNYGSANSYVYVGQSGSNYDYKSSEWSSDVYYEDYEVILPKGKHRINIYVYSQGEDVGIVSWNNAQPIDKEFKLDDLTVSSLCERISIDYSHLPSFYYNWSSSNSNVASYYSYNSWDKTTYFNINSIGETTISASCDGYSYSFKLIVKSWTEYSDSLILDRLTTRTLASVFSSQGSTINSNILKQFTYSSSDNTIASIDSIGNITANSIGDCVLTMTDSLGNLARYNIKVINGTLIEDATIPSDSRIVVDGVWTSHTNPWTKQNNAYYTSPEDKSFMEYQITLETSAAITFRTYRSNYYSSHYYSIWLDDALYCNVEDYDRSTTIDFTPGTHRVRFVSEYAGWYLYTIKVSKFYDDTFAHAIINHAAKMDTIVLSREGILGGEALKLHDNLSDFTGLCVSGPFDDYDWKTLSEMTNLKCLDISGVIDDNYPSKCNTYVNAVKMSEYIDAINGNPFESSNLNFMHIPDNVKSLSGTIHGATNIFFLSGCDGVETIGASAFYPTSTGTPYYNPSGLFGDLVFPSLRSVGNSAFRYCKNIKSFSAPVLETIGQYAFADTRSMNAFSAESVDSIASRAFMSSGIKYINMPRLRYVGDYAFSKQSSYDSYYSYYYYALDSINIPVIETIGSYAFWGQSSLKGANIKTVVAIGSCAFSNTALDSLNIPNAITINTSAFYGCNAMKYADVRRATTIGDAAFSGCTNLDSINMSKAQSIGIGAFRNTGLKEIKLPNVTTLSRASFKGCAKTTSLELSDKLTAIGDSSFYGCTSLETVTLPASLTHLPAKCFNGSNNIRTISINAPAPPSVGETPFTMQTVYTAQLYVPESSIGLYQAHDYWKHFYYYNVNPDVLTDLVLASFINVDTVRMDKIRMIINPGAGLSMSGNKAQDFRSVTFKANSTSAGMFLSNSERISSDECSIELEMSGLTWYYFCLPFDVTISDIKNSTGALLAIHNYNGANRATNGTGNNWTRMYSGTLSAGTGYIIQSSKATTLTFPATYETKDRAFLPYDVTTTLQANESTTASNKGWNYVGNPYMTYFDIAKLDFDAPITVREGSTYTAYSIEDDEYALRPMQPFFVQCPTGTTHLKFDAAGRQTSATIVRETPTEVNASRAMVATTRSILDITLSNGEESDRTRVVVNKEASDSYEIGCDAAKMMSDGAVQLYTIAEEERYAINEGPQASGTISMGFNVPADGKYTIALTRGNLDVSLYDAQEDVTISLNEGAYTFQTEAGENENRFMLILANTTGIENLQQKPEAAQFYDLTGKRMSRPENGLSIKRQNSTVNKQFVR